MPRNHGDLLLVALEAIELCVHLTDIKHLDFVIAATRQEPIAIDWVPSDLVNRRVVSMDLINMLSALPWIPDLHVLVLTARQNQ